MGAFQSTCHLCRYFRRPEGLDEANGMIEHGGGHGACIVYVILCLLVRDNRVVDIIHTIEEMVKAPAGLCGDVGMTVVVRPIYVGLDGQKIFVLIIVESE